MVEKNTSQSAVSPDPSKRSLWQRIPLALRIIIVSMAIIFLLKATGPEPKTVEQKERTWVVQETRVQPDIHKPILTLLGRVESPSAATYSAAISAFVNDVLIKEGDWVETGQLLVQLDDAEVQLQVRQREAELAEIRARITSEEQKHQTDVEALKIQKELLELQEKSVKRISRLAKKQLSAQKQLDDATTALQQQRLTYANRELTIKNYESSMEQLLAQEARVEAMLGLANIQLEKSRIVATVPGRISKVHIAHGDTVNIGAQLVSVFSEDLLEVRAQVPNKHLSLLRDALAGNLNHIHLHDTDVHMPYALLEIENGERWDPFQNSEQNHCRFIDQMHGNQMSLTQRLIRAALPAAQTEKDMPENYMVRVEDGHEEEFNKPLNAIATIDDHKVYLQLVRLSSSANSNTGGVDALFRLVGSAPFLELGRALSLELTLPPVSDSIALPAQAIHGLNRVYIIEGQRIRGVNVERLGFTRNSKVNPVPQVLIRSNDIYPGQLLMTSQLPQAVNGLRVRSPVSSCI